MRLDTNKKQNETIREIRTVSKGKFWRGVEVSEYNLQRLITRIQYSGADYQTSLYTRSELRNMISTCLYLLSYVRFHHIMDSDIQIVKSLNSAITMIMTIMSNILNIIDLSKDRSLLLYEAVYLRYYTEEFIKRAKEEVNSIDVEFCNLFCHI